VQKRFLSLSPPAGPAAIVEKYDFPYGNAALKKPSAISVQRFYNVIRAA
jgi:hypothetical protein